MNKSIITNLSAVFLVVASLLLSDSLYQGVILSTGLFALSGGVTNWLAIYMLFEKIPGLYGSGVIPAQFEEFKHGIKKLIMEQFFNVENLNKFFDSSSNTATSNPDQDSNIKKLIDAVDLNGAFESLVEVIMASSFGGMLSMVGGVEALQPLKEPFVAKMKEFLSKMGDNQEVMAQFKQSSGDALLAKVEEIVDQRLQELTPELVKDIIQQMIRQHLGWLVVWGGVIGGLIGLLVALFTL